MIVNIITTLLIDGIKDQLKTMINQSTIHQSHSKSTKNYQQKVFVRIKRKREQMENWLRKYVYFMFIKHTDTYTHTPHYCFHLCHSGRKILLVF